MRPLRKRLGTAIRKIRSGANLSQEALAQRARLHRTTMSEIERGISNVSIDAAERIAKALGVKLSQLLAEAEKER
jgi:transcriptional regulator with XRE-family HTH domain